MEKTKKRKTMIQKQSKYLWFLTMIMICICLWPIQAYAEPPEQIVYEGPVFEENEDQYYPEEILEQNGKRYQRVSVEMKPVEKRGELTYVSTEISCQLEGKQMPPECAEISLVFDRTGEEYQREVSLQEIREKSTFWEADFTFPITVYGYGAEFFFLGEYEVPAETNLAEYSDYFLEYLNLPKDCYRIERVEWNGEVYESEGVLCRDAVAYGEKLIRDVEAVYGGQVRTPNIPAKQYIAVYEELAETEVNDETTAMEPEEEDDEKASAIPEVTENQSAEESFVGKVARWIKEHITVVVFTGLFLSCFAGALLLLWLTGKKQTKDTYQEEINKYKKK